MNSSIDGLSPASNHNKSKDDFINKAHEARLTRELTRKRENAAINIQAFLRASHVRRKLKKENLQQFEDIIRAPTFSNGNEALFTLRRPLFFCISSRDRSTLDSLIQFVIKTSSLKDIELASTTNNISNNDTNNSTDTPKSLIEDAIRESIELSDDHIITKQQLQQQEQEQNETSSGSTTNFDQNHKSFIRLIAENSSQKEQSRQQWLNVLKRIINLCFDYLMENSTRLDSQHIDYYLKLINLLTSTESLNDMIDIDRTVQVTHQETLKRIWTELFTTTLNQRESFFESLTKLICERISRFRNDLKTSILSNYVNIMLKLLQLNQAKHIDHQELIHQTTSSKGSREILINMLCIPSFIYNLEKHSPNSLKKLNNNSIFKTCIKLLVDYQDFHKLASAPSVCLLANLVHLASLNEESLAQETVDFVALITKVLNACQQNMLKVSSAILTGHPRLSAENSNNNNRKGREGLKESMDVIFNPVLGWLVREEAISIDKDVIKTQLSHLWSLRFLKIFFNDLIQSNTLIGTAANSNKVVDGSQAQQVSQNKQKNNNNSPFKYNLQNLSISDNNSNNSLQSTGLFRRVVERATSTMSKTIYPSSYPKMTGISSNSGRGKLITPEASRIASVCLMLHTTLKTLITFKQDILTGLCLHDFILPKLWKFISSLGPNNGLKAFLEHLTIYTKTDAPEFHILILFCECSSHLISILDDSELYEKQQPFQLEDLIAISSFLNNFVFRIICNNLVPITKKKETDPILNSTHKLLTDLYKRDCRRKFTPQDHWLIKDIKMSLFLKDLEAKKPIAKAIMNMLPHIIPHKERVLVFRRLVSRDKAQHYTGSSTLITIHRSRIVEDGYQQLIRLPPAALKGLIRVKFINDYGLDEAGIDQDGVFKEFLEDTIKRVFDPALNLFCSTSEQRLYPSPTSRLHEDYLSLFNFVGKMLGKAVYEGIVVDVPFASFFLSRVLGQPQSPLYSPIDELPSLDPELYKSLTYIKHYEGDVSELDLTFSIDQDFMGKIETHELEPGGRSIGVTRESRVRYIHSVANFRMKTQIEKQTEAFVNGFRSIINLEWLSMFSASEFQRLISGDNNPIDLQDLRRNTKYFGGFHNNHRVICWLWDILEKDFSAEDHRLFLKFVTSCSKPPLLGFSNLEPPFSIRCVEVSDDQDLGDTVGSVLRGFFAIRRSDPVDRLPTSSTCFNLLKLPNYQRRSVMKAKLLYAIKSNPGFELS